METKNKIAADFDPAEYSWINPPSRFTVGEGSLTFYTDHGTDLWQRTYYGFRNDNGHIFVKETEGDFTFTVKVVSEGRIRYDQCGIIVYRDSDNWVKASVEYENNLFARLGSVVTNLGYSDWASTDIPANFNVMWYCLSRRGQDFLIETSSDGKVFQQMRIFHMHPAMPVARVGVYGCSPGQSSFKAFFSGLEYGPCVWTMHSQH